MVSLLPEGYLFYVAAQLPSLGFFSIFLLGFYLILGGKHILLETLMDLLFVPQKSNQHHEVSAADFPSRRITPFLCR